MNIIVLLIPLALMLAFGAVWAFIWASSSGQYDDLKTPAYRILLEEDAHNERKHS